MQASPHPQKIGGEGQRGDVQLKALLMIYKTDHT
jgi:hypothetical protein